VKLRQLAVTLGLALALVVTSSPAQADDGASLESWTAGFCSSVAHWFTTAGEPPAPDPNGDQLLAIRRAVGDVVGDGHAWMLYSVKVEPPVPGGRKLVQRIRRALSGAIDEVQHASDLLAGPKGSSSDTLSAAQRHLNDGYDQVVTTMQKLRGHSGNPKFDAAMKTNPACAYITSLTPIGSSSAV
jgi:hypothetical protein